jgi:tetratricopeptide (TPR) repeat protein
MRTHLVAASCVSACLVLWPCSADAQKARFVKGLEELTQAMVEMPADATRVRVAIDTMAAGLQGWDDPTPPGDAGLLDDNASTAVLPLAAYADGFKRLILGDYAEAVASLRRGAQVTEDERTRLIAAGLLVQENRVDDAERALLAILDKWPDSAITRWWLARLYETRNRVREARSQYEAILPVALAGRAQIYAAIGRLARREGDFDAALNALRRRAQVSPRDPGAHKDLARVLVEIDRADEALTEFAAALTLDPRDAETHAAIGRIHLDAGHPADAIPALRRALGLMPERHEVRYALAMALKQAGQNEEAARELQVFERASRESVNDRRRTMAAEVEREEAVLQGAGR